MKKTDEFVIDKKAEEAGKKLTPKQKEAADRMHNSENVPYVAKRDKNGKITNPIKRSYMSFGPTRRQRRFEQNHPDGKRPTGLIVYKNGKDWGFWQKIPLYEGVKVKEGRKTITVRKVTGFKFIYHSLPIYPISKDVQAAN